ncbi:MAG TPA: glycosyltransferase family 87 protein [Terriglobales bacterium]|nr:glycosyltransferase family 87 protein [Terriglobales bacterium]
MDAITRREYGLLALLACAAAGLALVRPDKAIDFRVYWENARHYFAGAPPWPTMYGPASGTGWAGGVYRYPPIFLDLFRPLALLPLRWGAALWAAAKMASVGWLAIALRRRWCLPSALAFWPAILLLAPYVIQDLRYGNAQLFIVVLACAAFAQGPVIGGAGLGWGAALKVWPLFFYPFLAVQRRWRMLAAACGVGVAATLLPALWRGWSSQMRLLGAWLAQERTIAATSSKLGELWYPGQSLHDVLARYLTRMDFARLADARYPQIAWLQLSPATLNAVWWSLALVLAAGLAFLLWRAHATAALGPAPSNDAQTALLFCAVVVLEPHVHRLILDTLLWPALYLAGELWRRRLAGWQLGLFWIAIAASALEPLVPGSARQRALQAYGTDFWLVVLPLTLAAISLQRVHHPQPGKAGKIAVGAP